MNVLNFILRLMGVLYVASGILLFIFRIAAGGEFFSGSDQDFSIAVYFLAILLFLSGFTLITKNKLAAKITLIAIPVLTLIEALVVSLIFEGWNLAYSFWLMAFFYSIGPPICFLGYLLSYGQVNECLSNGSFLEIVGFTVLSFSVISLPLIWLVFFKIAFKKEHDLNP